MKFASERILHVIQSIVHSFGILGLKYSSSSRTGHASISANLQLFVELWNLAKRIRSDPVTDTLKNFNAELTAAAHKNPALSADKPANMKYVIEPIDFETIIGSSSRETNLQKVILTVAK